MPHPASGPHIITDALAALAVEEAGKAAALFVLALMPRGLRAQAPLGRLLQWHQLKLVGGMLIAAVPFGTRTIAAQLLGHAGRLVSIGAARPWRASPDRRPAR